MPPRPKSKPAEPAIPHIPVVTSMGDKGKPAPVRVATADVVQTSRVSVHIEVPLHEWNDTRLRPGVIASLKSQATASLAGTGKALTTAAPTELAYSLYRYDTNGNEQPCADGEATAVRVNASWVIA